ncbi:MAG: DUF1003 domain-containing protein [Actinobacteria bacterium]|nr:DUF1003 domain-containing protein [Actinomycetota bacterium]
MAQHPTTVERITSWTGSVSSLVIHTLAFLACGLVGALGVAEWNTVLLILTTAVSLEAIYLALFIQMTMNRQAESLKNVEEDIDEIQGDVDEIQKDVDEIQEDVDEIQEDVDEIQKDVDEIQEDGEEELTRDGTQQKMLGEITTHLQALMNDIERLKKV